MTSVSYPHGASEHELKRRGVRGFGDRGRSFILAGSKLVWGISSIYSGLISNPNLCDEPVPFCLSQLNLPDIPTWSSVTNPRAIGVDVPCQGEFHRWCPNAFSLYVHDGRKHRAPSLFYTKHLSIRGLNLPPVLRPRAYSNTTHQATRELKGSRPCPTC